MRGHFLRHGCLVDRSLQPVDAGDQVRRPPWITSPLGIARIVVLDYAEYADRGDAVMPEEPLKIHVPVPYLMGLRTSRGPRNKKSPAGASC